METWAWITFIAVPVGAFLFILGSVTIIDRRKKR